MKSFFNEAYVKGMYDSRSNLLTLQSANSMAQNKTKQATLKSNKALLSCFTKALLEACLCPFLAQFPKLGGRNYTLDRTIL